MRGHSAVNSSIAVSFPREARLVVVGHSMVIPDLGYTELSIRAMVLPKCSTWDCRAREGGGGEVDICVRFGVKKRPREHLTYRFRCLNERSEREKGISIRR